MSRPGTLFCGVCKEGQFGLAIAGSPPRNIPFAFSVTQGFTIEAGDHYFRFLTAGGYILESPTTITNISTGTITDPGHSYSNGNEVFLSGVQGMIQLNGQTYIVINATTNTFQLQNQLTGAIVSTVGYSPYAGGGTAARVYTVATPYAVGDLPYLKFAQSADVMSFTHPLYPPYDLARVTDTDWRLTKTDFGSATSAPTSISGTANGTGTASFYYQFVATAVDKATGQESAACPPTTILSVDIAVQAGSIQLNCAPVGGAGSYNFYSAPECYLNPPNAGALFGYIGTAYGPAFTDTNIVPDFTTTPPLHRNPFATSSLLAVVMTGGGSSYSSTATTATVISPIGKNPILTPVIVGGSIVWTVVDSGGEGLTGGEAVNFVDATSAGSGATATLQIGPATGTFPSCVSYFQQRRVYANTNNAPDTYFATQTGTFTNMDTSLPTQADDAIIGSPWSQQVNGIQWMLNMPGGLVIFTGLGAWQLSGGGGGLATTSALTPSSQIANPQAYNGSSPLVPPIAINYDILYVQEKGSIVRDLSYNYFVNIYTGTDMTVLSNHLFDNHTILQWAWCEEPFKLIWAVRDDGILLCLTYLKEQDVYAWSRHDTNGLFQSVCSVSEPPVNALYVIVKRLIRNDSTPTWAYFQERMANRLWQSQESCWCVDAGLTYIPAEPDAILEVYGPDTGIPTLSQPMLVYGGANYSPTTYGQIIDPTGEGAVLTLTIVAGVVTAAAVSGSLVGYTNPEVRIVDPTGVGGGAVVFMQSFLVTRLVSSVPIFNNIAGEGEAGDIVRMGGRQIEIAEYVDNKNVIGNILQDHQPGVTDDPFLNATLAFPGQWSIAAPIQTVYGLSHLEGMLVSIIADGVVEKPQIVQNGSITLQNPATVITVGLGYQVQMQTLYLEIPGGPTVQGRRKEIDSVVVRINNTGCPFEVGVNQPDASTQPGMVNVPWTNMVSAQGAITGSNTPLQPYDLNTDDVYLDIFDQLGLTKGQVAIQQTGPLPLEVLAVIPSTRLQDDVDAP